MRKLDFAALISRTPAWQVFAIISLASLLGTLGTTYAFYQRALEAFEYQQRRELMQVARTAAVLVDGDRHRALAESGTLDSADYLALVAPLRALRKSGIVAEVYTMVLRGDEVLFVLDAAEDSAFGSGGESRRALLREPYPDAPPELLEALHTGAVITDEAPTRDRWGTWMSAYAPIRDAQGRRVGIAGVDLPAEEYWARRGQIHLAGAIAFATSVLISVLFGLGGYAFQRFVTRHDEELTRRNDELREANEELRALQENLQQQSDRLALVIEAADLGIWEWDYRTGSTFGNERRFAMLGYRPGEISGRLDDWLDLVHPDDLPDVHEHLEAHLAGTARSVTVEHRMRAKSGEWRWVLTSGRVVERDEEGRPVRLAGIQLDVDQRKSLEEEVAKKVVLLRRYSHELEQIQRQLGEANAKLDRLAKTDGLTGVANRRFFQTTLSQLVVPLGVAPEPVSLVMIDIDHFKQFNDTFGHQEGDAVLIKVASLISESVRESDVVARYGGEEFAVLSRGCRENDALQLAERIRAAVAAFDWPLRPVTVSLGTATFLGGEFRPEELVRRADEALYASKQAGRNRVTSGGVIADRREAA